MLFELLIVVHAVTARSWLPEEQAMRQTYGIPDNADQVLIFGSSSHDDWDWRFTHSQYYTTMDGYASFTNSSWEACPVTNLQYPQQCVRAILDNAIASVKTPLESPNLFYYSVAEVGYLLDYWNDQEPLTTQCVGPPPPSPGPPTPQHQCPSWPRPPPASLSAPPPPHPNRREGPRAANLRSAFQAPLGFDRFRLLGGGITSPDNILPNGEAFFRNFLIGWKKIREMGLPFGALQGRFATNLWIPDDFGSDRNLPAMTAALGFRGVAFERVPGDCQYFPNMPAHPIDPTVPSDYEWFAENGVDFTWEADDHSTVQGTVLIGSYGWGDSIGGDAYGNIDQFVQNSLQKWLTDNPTYNRAFQLPYIFVPVGNDFSAYTPCPAIFEEYQNNWTHASGKPYAILLHYDGYIDLTSFWRREAPLSPAMPYFSQPYWMGMFGSRTGLKVMHEDVSRRTLEAEAFHALTLGRSPIQAGLDGLWMDVAASTHHDFITGTAWCGYDPCPDPSNWQSVYFNEQRPLMANAVDYSIGNLTSVLWHIATTGTTGTAAGAGSVLLANGLGISGATGPNRGRRVLIPGMPRGFNSLVINGVGYPATPTDNSECAGCYAAFINPTGPPLVPYSYVAASLTFTTSPTPTAIPTPRVRSLGGNYYLSNGLFTATVNTSTFVVTAVNRFSPSPSPLLIDPTNGLGQLHIYFDSGDLYALGNQALRRDQPCPDSGGGGFYPVPGLRWENKAAPQPLEVAARASLRVTRRVVAPADFLGTEVTVEFSVETDDPTIRVSVSGIAPPGTSVLFGATFASPITGGIKGSTYHWDSDLILPQLPPSGPQREKKYFPCEQFTGAHDFVLPTLSPAPVQGTVPGVLTPSVRGWAVSTRDSRTLLGMLWRTPKFTEFGRLFETTENIAYTHLLGIRVPGIYEVLNATNLLRDSLAMASRIATFPIPSGTRLPAPRILAQTSLSSCTAIMRAAKLADRLPSALILRFYNPRGNDRPATCTCQVEVGVDIISALVTSVTALEDADVTNAVSNIRSISARVFQFTMHRAIATLRVPLITTFSSPAPSRSPRPLWSSTDPSLLD